MAEEEESWHEFYQNNRLTLPHPSRRITEGGQKGSVPFFLSIKSVEGIRIPDSISVAANELEFQLRVTLYDIANKYFFGSTWLGPVIAATHQNGRFIVDLEEVLYFHSSLNDVSCVAAIEVVTYDKNEQGCSCGWTILRIFDHVSELRDTSNQAIITRLSLYRGSLGVLLFLPVQDALEEQIDSQRIEGCFMSYSLQTHNVLEKALHLIPENALLGGDDIVPGILEIVQEDSGFVDILKKPRLMKTNPCFINKLTVDFQPSVNEFEENLLHDLNMDRLHRDNISPDDGLKISIVERRLRVCVHNGWTFVSEPHMVYLEPEFEGGGSKSGRKSPITPQTSLTGSKIASLVLRSRLELRELVRHPLFAVVFEVEYVISEPYAQPLINPKKKKASLSGSLLRSQNQTITVRWAVWTPFGDIHPDDRDAYLTLECGGIHPGARMVYHGFNKKPGSIYLSFTHQKRRGSNVPSNSTRGSQLLPDLTTPAQMPQTGLGQMSSHSSLGGDQDQSAGLRPGIASRPPLPGKSRTIGEYPPVGPGQGRPEAPVPVTSLTEVPHSSLHTPLLLSSTVGSSRGSTLTRADYARLSRAGYPPITDRHGNPPLVIDPAEYVPLNLDNENMDSLQANEIVLHFLALNRCYGHRSVFFTFQFYRFPQVTTERLFLKNSDNQSQGDLCVLQKFNKDGSLSNEAPGLLLKYLVDPAFMQRGENRVFCRYLLSQTIHMDVWDGDSLLLIGSLAIELKHLLRQGREAVLVSHEVDIVSVEFSEDAPAMPGDVTRTGTVRPVGMRAGVEGALHIRMANIGHHSEMNTDMIGTVPKKHSHVIMSETIRGTLSGTAAAGVTMRSKAKPVAECDGELAAVLFSRQNKINKNDKPVSQNDAIRKRKLERMQAVRQIKGTDNKVDNLVVQKEEKLQRARDLKTIQLYRDKNKREGIMSLLCANITTTHTIYPSFGAAEFFEFVIRNPYNTEQTISIQCDDKELTVITDTREWKHFKRFTETFSAIEENMFNTADTPYPEVFLRPGESVHIPFKFQTFRADHSVPEQGPSHPLRQNTLRYRKFASVDDNKLQPRSVKVSFVMKDNRPVSILDLKVEPRPHVIDQTFRFYNPEQSFLKKSIRLPPWHSLPGAPVIDEQAPPHVNVRCSDFNVVCEAKRVQPNEPQDVFLKVACGPSPSVKRFFLLLFIDPFMAIPCQTWQFYVHSLQRVDISAVEGQTSQLSVILRGTQSSRLVQCFTSHAEELQVRPSDPFMLMANGVHEISLSLTPLTSGGTRYMYVNVVDNEFHQLVRTWLVCATCQQPVISKAFELQLQVGGGKGSNKRVTFTNPYPTRKAFHLKSNRPDLLQFKEDTIEVGPGASHNIGLRFSPQPAPAVTQILIFINDSEGKNEETFSITAVYK
ncbi:nephrocystin-4 isoform X2 [Nematostella vectensis]|uniref:nephrocystin-4 isoform X2 n=1 Tax=Nematostella vectensis TaxID=45351 RepID=UPI00207713BC|nr:nephrocystin-4 isoform X2 [Nematostella vectensis]